MWQRSCMASLMRAENKFHRAKGDRHVPELLKAIDRPFLATGRDDKRKIA